MCVAISNGVRDEKLREKLWSQDLELDDIISKCQLWEQKEHIKHLYTEKSESKEDVYMASYRRKTRSTSNPRGHSFGASSRGSGSSQRGNSYGAPGQHSSGSRHTKSAYRGRGRGATGDHSQQYSFVKNCMKCGRSHAMNRCPAYGKSVTFVRNLTILKKFVDQNLL